MIVVGISGASGPIMGVRLIEELLNAGEQVTGLVSEHAWPIITYELSYPRNGKTPLKTLLQNRGVVCNFDNFTEFNNSDFFSPVASGSSRFEAMVVIPCSMKTLSAIANGYASTLITRTADVALKERRQCIIVPRETPLSLIHIENLRKAAGPGHLSCRRYRDSTPNPKLSMMW